MPAAQCSWGPFLLVTFLLDKQKKSDKLSHVGGLYPMDRLVTMGIGTMNFYFVAPEKIELNKSL